MSVNDLQMLYIFFGHRGVKITLDKEPVKMSENLLVDSSDTVNVKP